jgi:ribonuclease G
MNRLVFTEARLKEKQFFLGALQEEGTIRELRLLKTSSPGSLGNIYTAIVEKVAEHMQAAFLLISPDLRAWFHLSETKHLIYTDAPGRGSDALRQTLHPGDCVLVQVCREAMKGKLASVTARLEVTGKYFVVSLGTGRITFSSRLGHRERQILKAQLLSCGVSFAGFDLLVRTNAAVAAPEAFLTELNCLCAQLSRICEQGRHYSPFSLLYTPENNLLRWLRDFPDGYLQEAVTDDPAFYKKLCCFLEEFPSHVSLRLYEDRMVSLSCLYELEKEIAEALSEQVWLKSGGNLVIQQTEAFVSIDVNSGKYGHKAKAVPSAFRINCEAIPEINRQIRLRNLSGVILIDLINMKSEDERSQVMAQLKEAVSHDRIPCTVVDLTALQIAELTRKKTEPPLAEQMKDRAEY